jgi:hypothetical protein
MALLALVVPLALAACDDRECSGYNDCGDDAYCTGDGVCVSDPIGVRTTRVGGFTPPGAPVDFASGQATADLTDAYLDGDFGLMPLNREPATSASVWESETGTDIWIETRNEETGEWAMIGMWSMRRLDEVLPSGQAPVVLDLTDVESDTGGVVCSENLNATMFDEPILQLTVTEDLGPEGTTYKLAAVTGSINAGYEATAVFGSETLGR